MIHGVTPLQIETIYNSVLEGDVKGAQAGVKAALVAVLVLGLILGDGLIDATGEVGRLFEKNGYFVPEMLVSVQRHAG